MHVTDVANAMKIKQPSEKKSKQLFFSCEKKLQVCLMFLKLSVIDHVLILANRTINMSVFPR